MYCIHFLYECFHGRYDLCTCTFDEIQPTPTPEAAKLCEAKQDGDRRLEERWLLSCGLGVGKAGGCLLSRVWGVGYLGMGLPF